MIGVFNRFRKNLSIRPVQTVSLGFAAVIFSGALLLTLPFAAKSGESSSFLTALFTSTSATCVTGLVVVDTYTHWSLFGQIVILLLIQTGGLGFMTIATLFSLVLRRKITLKQRLVLAESINQYSLQGIISLTRKIIFCTLFFEGTGAVLLSFRFVPELGLARGVYYGVFHSVSAFCNAGFDLMGRFSQFSSLSRFVSDPVVNLVMMGLIVTGGLGFAVLSDLYSVHSFKRLHLHTKLVLSMTGALLLIGFLFFLIMEHGNPDTLGPLSPGGKILAAMFQSVTPRTAGFNTIDISKMRTSSIFVTILLMFIGGSPGSTAGGIKTTTLGVILFFIISAVKGREDTELFHKRLPRSIVVRAFTLTFIGMALVGIVTIIVTIFEKASLMAALFEVTSAFGTVGLSLGLTPHLCSISRIALIITMFFGRVGVLTIILSLANRSLKDHLKYRYPEEKITVG